MKSYLFWLKKSLICVRFLYSKDKGSASFKKTKMRIKKDRGSPRDEQCTLGSEKQQN